MTIIFKYRWFLLLLLTSLILRIFVYAQVMNRVQNPDYYLYREWAYKSYSYGLKNIYSIHSPHGIIDIDQPPGSIYILSGSYEVFNYTARVFTHFLHLTPGSTLWINDNLLIFFLRLPSIIADLILGACIFIFLRNRVNKKIALLSSALFLLSPPTIYNSSVWGQMDSINNLFFYLSLMFLIWKKQFLSIFFLGLSLFVKFSLLPIIPFYFLFVLLSDNFNFRSLLKSILQALAIFVILCIPFTNNPMWAVTTFTKVAQGINQSITANAYNFWWLILSPLRPTTTQEFITSFMGIDINLWAYLIFCGVCIPIIFYAKKLSKIKKLNAEQIFFISFLVLLTAFIFLPKMHERYLYPIFPLLITWVGFKNKHWISFFILSIFNFLNMYLIWNPQLYLFQKFEYIIRDQLTPWLISLGTLIIFLFYYLKIFNFKYNFHKKSKN